MSEAHPISAQKHALRGICRHGPLDTSALGRYLVAAFAASTDARFAPVVERMAGMLAWCLHSQGFIAEAEPGGPWTTTTGGRELINCTGERR